MDNSQVTNPSQSQPNVLPPNMVQPDLPTLPGKAIDTVSTGLDKEHEPQTGNFGEILSVTEIETSPEIPFEVQEYVSKTEKNNLELDKPVVIHGTPLVESSHPTQPVVQLPLSRQGIISGVTRPVSEAIRWLATWCIKMIKKFPGRVVYSSEPHRPNSI